jgi:zinc/manganese transport system substrate-binding protein
MKTLYKLMLLTILVGSNLPAFATTNVLACEPEWAALAKELGGEHVTVNSATTAFQDPHHIQARPSLISKARRADLLICSGAELEIGWLPILLKKSGNRKIQSKANGHIMAAEQVELLGKLAKATRSMGDVHAAGNPHVHLDPYRMTSIADVVTSKLIEIDPMHTEDYENNHSIFKSDMAAMLERLQPTIDLLKNKRWVVHHNNWSYLNEWLKLEQIATLESKPGVPPTTKHLAKLISTLKDQPVGVIAYGSYQPKKAALWLGKKTNTPVMEVPYSIVDWENPKAIVSWYESLVTEISSALAP